MTKEEAIKAIVDGGLDVVGVTVHPRDFGLFEYAEIVGRALQQRPDLVQEIEKIMKDPERQERIIRRCEASIHRN